MNNFFDINSVAIVGASSVELKVGNSLINNLLSFKGAKYGVNPKGGEYNGIHFFKSIIDLPIVPDVLVFAIPAKFVLSSLKDAGNKGVKRVIIISAGFKEVGNIDLENELIEVSNKYNIALLGPNCLGYVDAVKQLNLSFGAKSIESCTGKRCNNIAMISQSGAMAVALTDWAKSRKMGFSKMISMGNKAGINENDLLVQLENDNETKVISMYLESIEKGEEFYEITKKISKKYPLVLVKSGVSEKGSKAASSHTGALASGKVILETAFEHSGIHYTQSLENFFLWSQIFSEVDIANVPEELVIITNAGGPGVMATDHTETYGVKLTEFSDVEKEILKEGLPDAASVANPIDIIGDATSKTYAQILNNLSKIVTKRAILIMLTAQTVTDVENIANIIIDFKIAYPNEFVMVSFMGGESVEKARDLLSNAGILEYDYPKKAIRAFSRLDIQKRWQNKQIEEAIQFKLPKNIENLKKKLEKEKQLCSNDLTGNILESFNINYTKEILVSSEKDVENALKSLKCELFVARISSADIPHKSDVGGVILNINGKKEAINAYKLILENVKQNAPEAIINGITFSKMIIKNNTTRDIFVGFKRDISFGNILIVGMGGIYVNVIEDVTRRIGIVSKKEIQIMLRELKSFPILNGTRGEKSIDFDKLIDNIFKLQFVFKEFTEIKEIDINPILSDRNDSIVVDAKFYL